MPVSDIWRSHRRWFALGPPVGMGDDGMSTVEYAIGTIAAAAFASILYTVVTGESVVSALTALVNQAMRAKLG